MESVAVLGNNEPESNTNPALGSSGFATESHSIMTGDIEDVSPQISYQTK
jgi:hypothetical protein